MKKFILDTLFPISCLSCGAPDDWLCPVCFQKISLLRVQVCPYCEKIETPSGKICRACKDSYLRKNIQPPLDGLIVATKYKENEVPRLIHTFKYSFVTDLGRPLSKLILEALLENNLPLPDLIIPVPLHPRRERWRGFNQAKVLAQFLVENLSPGLAIPLRHDLIARKKFTPPQMKIKNYSARQKNLAGVFTLSNHTSHAAIENKNVLLIDDVATTGATLFEAARVLKSAGAKKVYAAVIARQEIL